MTAVKETPRPASQHRPSFSSGPSSLPRNSYTRPHAYSSSIGSFNPAHRITRRKSSTLNPAAIHAAVHALDGDNEEGGKAINRRSMQARAALGNLNSGSYPSPPGSLPQAASLGRHNSSAVVDGPSLASISDKLLSKNRVRRASDGSNLSKKKSGNGDLKCETCGKAYKHSSCLTKHLWEHTPEWTITSKLLISKHQQVQLLEAASVLLAMNNDAQDPSKTSDSEQSSASPAASGSSDREDEISSAETTPPPQSELIRGHRKQFSTASSGYSRSYQSVFSTSGEPASHPSEYMHHRQWSTSSTNRPVTAGTSVGGSYAGGEDQADLAAAVGLLSCSYGTPQTGPSAMPSDVPPVPPLPERYQQEMARRRQEEDIDMNEASSDEEDEESSSRSQSHAYSRADDDDGVFGNMDE